MTFLAGCFSADKNPRALPSIRTPVVSARPATSAAVTPDATAESVRTFVRSYFDEINRAITTGRIDRLRELSVAHCACRRLADFIANGHGGPNVTGGQFTVLSVTTHDVTPTLVGAEVTYDVAEARIRNASHQVIQRLPGFHQARDDLSVVRYRDRWLVAEVVELTQ